MECRHDQRMFRRVVPAWTILLFAIVPSIQDLSVESWHEVNSGELQREHVQEDVWLKINGRIVPVVSCLSQLALPPQDAQV